MIFVRSAAENFLSISSPITWEIENQGLVLVLGENRDSEAAESNGTGKSALVTESIVWCLWGRTLRDQHSDDVINRKVGKNCKVAAWLKNESGIYCITRYRRHDTEGNGLRFCKCEPENEDLTLGTSTLTQERINTFLGIDYSTFIQGPMIPQGRFKKFSEMTDGEQKVIFDRALQIGVISEALKETNGQLNGIRQNIAQEENNQKEIQRDLTEKREAVAQLTESKNNWAASKIVSLSMLMRSAVESIIDQEEIEKTLKDYSKEAEEAEAELKAMTEERDSLSADWNKTSDILKGRVAETRATLKHVVLQIQNLRADIKNIKSLSEASSKGAACPTCKQEISPQHIKRCLEASEKSVSEKDNEYTALTKKIKEQEKDIMDRRYAYSVEYEAISMKISKYTIKTKDLIKAKAEAEASKRELANLKHQEEGLRRLFIEKQKEPNPFTLLSSGLSFAIDDIVKKKLACSKAKLRNYKLHESYLLFWQYGFSNKGIKTHILSTVTPFLNERAAHYANVLTNGELKIEFSTQTTLQSGESREKFSVQVENKNGASTYAGNSGGEKCRADLAINFALSDLISSRSKNPYPQRFLDEPFENLDEPGIEAVMELLANSVKEAGSIFVVTHLESMKGLFSRAIKLVKEGGVTTLLEA
jgi:DNA repair exonuclease SbcCD ATPase subunit